MTAAENRLPLDQDAVLADLEETVAQVQRQLMRLTASIDRLESLRIDHGEGTPA